MALAVISLEFFSLRAFFCLRRLYFPLLEPFKWSTGGRTTLRIGIVARNSLLTSELRWDLTSSFPLFPDVNVSGVKLCSCQVCSNTPRASYFELSWTNTKLSCFHSMFTAEKTRTRNWTCALSPSTRLRSLREVISGQILEPWQIQKPFVINRLREALYYECDALRLYPQRKSWYLFSRKLNSRSWKARNEVQEDVKRLKDSTSRILFRYFAGSHLGILHPTTS